MDRLRGVQAVLLATALLALLVFPWAHAQRDDRTPQSSQTQRWEVHAWWTTTTSSGTGQQPARDTDLAGPDGFAVRNLLGAGGFTAAVALAGATMLPLVQRHPRKARIALACAGASVLLLVAAHEFWSPLAGLHDACGAALSESAQGALEHRCWSQETLARWFVTVPSVLCTVLPALRRAPSAQGPGLPALPDASDPRTS